mgnify:CR=1 FL=1
MDFVESFFGDRSYSLINHNDARGFNVDQDYLPIGTAPGGKPDMNF